jgi:hypothetical protein
LIAVLRLRGDGMSCRSPVLAPADHCGRTVAEELLAEEEQEKGKGRLRGGKSENIVHAVAARAEWERNER